MNITNLKSFKEVNDKVNPFWKGSTYEVLKNLASRTKGAVFEKIVAEIFENEGYTVDKAESSDHDRIIDGYKVEIKGSTAWSDTEDNFKWQQLRDQDYERIIFVGINPNSFDIWWSTKDELNKRILGNSKFAQHKGKAGSDTYWVSKKQDWFMEITEW